MLRRVRLRVPAWVLAIAGAGMLPACSGGSEAGEDTAAAPGEDTLHVMVGEAGDLSVVADALQDAGLAQVFDGVASYTLLAPNDAAFANLGEAGETLRAPEQRPALVAVLRDHIVPGYLTPEDIDRALELDDDNRVAMRTMAGHTLTFSKTGSTITATGEEGASVRFAGDALLASNGVAIPVDGLAVDVGEARASQ